MIVKTNDIIEEKTEEQTLIDLINTHNNVIDHGIEESKGYSGYESKSEDNDDMDDTTKKRPIRNSRCQHLWTTYKEDEEHFYKECEKCGRKTRSSRKGKAVRYNEPNPDKKLEINSWLRDYDNYIEGNAIYLDAQEMKTSNHLIENSNFNEENLIIPEFNEDTYNENKEDEQFGTRIELGDFLSILKENELEEMSLIYADFTGTYNNVVKPLLEYLQENNDKIRSGTILGFTWSNNGVGSKNERRKIDRDIGRFIDRNNYEEIDEIIDNGYGVGANMNVMFLRKL